MRARLSSTHVLPQQHTQRNNTDQQGFVPLGKYIFAASRVAGVVLMVPRAHALGGGWRAQGIGNVKTGPEPEDVGFLAADPLSRL